MSNFDVEAALARHEERVATKLSKRRRRMSECLCPDDGAELVMGPDDVVISERRSDVVIVHCTKCDFWMRVFQRDEHRPWMKRAWAVFFERTA